MKLFKKRYSDVNFKFINCKRCAVQVEVNTKTIKYCPSCLMYAKSIRYEKGMYKLLQLTERYKMDQKNWDPLGEVYLLQEKAKREGIIHVEPISNDDPVRAVPESQKSKFYYSKDLDPIDEEEERLTREIKNRLENVVIHNWN